MNNYNEIIEKINLSDRINRTISGNFGRTMTITMDEAFLFKILLQERLSTHSTIQHISPSVCPKCGNTGRCEPRTLSDPDGQECDCGVGPNCY
ncbi:MAG: hypothetical protein PF569_08615 [Candidatus Woesearchaeota archaeon]|jgi:hypothetical protein|nr:hypothetical protein [Candidatus Woesearchaeota archaeon]